MNEMKAPAGSVFEMSGVPPMKQVVPLGLQHVVAAIVGVITPAILVSNAVGLEVADKTLLIQVSLLITAIATLVQVFGLWRVGAKLPVVMGVSFAYVPTLLALANGYHDLGVILGAQIVGFDGVDKRIDVLATAMQAGMNAVALKDLDLAYAPPFSSAKDPVNMAGFMAENIEKGLVKQFHYEDVAALPRDGSVTLLDARTPQEYAKGNAEGFVNIPVDELRARLGELEAGKPVYVMCQSGLRSYIACRILAQNGFECYNFSGGYRFYQSIRDHRFVENVRTSCGQESEH